jgi:hypothetical protein
MPLEVVIPSPKTGEDLAFGEFIIDPANPTIIRTNYSDDSVGDKDLRGLGLSLLVTSSCGIHTGQFRRDWHARFPWTVHAGRKLDPVFRTCTCSIAREIGFHGSAATNYSKVLDFWILRGVGISVPLNPIEYQGLFSRVFLDRTRNALHMFSFGDLTSAACLSRHTWNSRSIEPMTDTLRKKLIELDDNLAASDLQCIGITYKPVLLDRAKLPQFRDSNNIISFATITDENVHSDLTNLARNHVFLGTLISGYEPKEDMQELIDDLENSGIRFVFFSPYSESITKAFGDRLGLETDWNSCIILSKRPLRPSLKLEESSLEFTDPKSKLPRGVHNIRPHLENVDDIPLHISLFAECEPASVSEMHRIYAENGETPICIGSTLNWSNTEIFVSAKTSIGMEPPNLRVIGHSGRMSSMHLSAALTALACPIILPFDCSPYVITEIIREARCLARASNASVTYRMLLCIILLVSTIYGRIGIFSLLSAAMVIFVSTTVFLFAPYEPDILKKMPKRVWDGAARRTQLVHYGLRGVLSGLIISGILPNIPADLEPLSIAILLGAISMTCLHDHLALSVFGPKQHLFWTISMSVILFTTFLITIVLTGLSLWEWFRCSLITSTALTILLIINELLKSRWRRTALRTEKRAKLQFNTKLGMHSPV